MLELSVFSSPEPSDSQGELIVQPGSGGFWCICNSVKTACRKRYQK